MRVKYQSFSAEEDEVDGVGEQKLQVRFNSSRCLQRPLVATHFSSSYATKVSRLPSVRLFICHTGVCITNLQSYFYLPLSYYVCLKEFVCLKVKAYFTLITLHLRAVLKRLKISNELNPDRRLYTFISEGHVTLTIILLFHSYRQIPESPIAGILQTVRHTAVCITLCIYFFYLSLNYIIDLSKRAGCL